MHDLSLKNKNIFIAKLFCIHLQTVIYVNIWNFFSICEGNHGIVSRFKFLKVSTFWAFELVHTMLICKNGSWGHCPYRRVFENPTEPQRSITGIFNNLHSKGVPELLSASYHHLKVFFFFFCGNCWGFFLYIGI